MIRRHFLGRGKPRVCRICIDFILKKLPLRKELAKTVVILLEKRSITLHNALIPLFAPQEKPYHKTLFADADTDAPCPLGIFLSVPRVSRSFFL